MTRCDGMCLSHLSASPTRPFLCKNPLFWSQTRRREGSIAYSLGGRSPLHVLSVVFLKSRTLGRFLCLRFSPNRRVCVLFLSRKKQSKNADFSLSVLLWEFAAQLLNGEALQTKAHGASLLLCFDYVLGGVYSKVLAGGLGSRGPERPTADPRCCRLLWACGPYCGPGEKFVFSVHAWILAAPPPCKMLSDLSASVLAIFEKN